MPVWLTHGVFPALIGAAFLLVLVAIARAKDANLAQRFADLGDLEGKPLDEITAAAGPPHAITAAEDGRTLYQWASPGYTIALVFKDNVCEGVHHESRG